MTTVVTVRTGKKYPVWYVTHMKRMMARYLPGMTRFVCLTDQPESIDGVVTVDISAYGLKSWYAKMLVFNRDVVGPGKILYIDLDMIVAGDLTPLVNLDCAFAICRNFTQINQARNGGRVTWGCGYGSCVMLLGEQFGTGEDETIWDKFHEDEWGWIEKAAQMGDQWIIEQIHPHAAILQDLLPPGFFLHYKDFPEDPLSAMDARVFVFAGKTKPHDCQIKWIRDKWHCRF